MHIKKCEEFHLRANAQKEILGFFMKNSSISFTNPKADTWGMSHSHRDNKIATKCKMIHRRRTLF